MVEEYKKIYNQEKKQIEKKYDDMLILSQDTIKNEFDKDFEKKMQESKKEIDKYNTAKNRFLCYLG